MPLGNGPVKEQKMLKMICLIVFLSALLQAQTSKAEPAPGSTQKRVLSSKGKQLPAEPNAPPKSAVKINDDLYRYVAPDGKKWTYKKTPFGWAKLDESQVTAPVKEDDDLTRVAGINGDTVQFVRPGPFGDFKWEKKKSELNEQEKAALARSENVKK
jgi:hypothetical protein